MGFFLLFGLFFLATFDVVRGAETKIEGGSVSNSSNIEKPEVDSDEVWEYNTQSKEEQMKTLLPKDFPSPVPLPFPLKHVSFNALASFDSDIVLYVHMPKTAGQTFHRILSRSFKNCDLEDMNCAAHAKKVVSPRLDLTYATSKR
jgi:hypothetical protein